MRAALAKSALRANSTDAVQRHATPLDRADRWLALSAVAITALVFGRSLTNGFTNFDDPTYYTANPMIQAGLSERGFRWAATAVVSGHWHPLTLLSHQLDWSLFGLNPTGPHAVSLLWHAMTAGLVYSLFRRLGAGAWLALAAALLFGIHPLRVESVAWIAERKDVISGCLGLVVLVAYLAQFSADLADRRRWRFYFVALLAFALGLAAKSMLVTLPAVLLLLDFWPLHRALRDPRVWLDKIPFFLLALASGLVALLAQQRSGGIESQGPAGARWANAVITLPRYLFNFVWPTGLAPHYPLRENWPALAVIGSALGGLGLAAVCGLQWKKRPWLLVGWAWFVGMLVPVSGLVQTGRQAMADRYTYLPCLGLEIILIFGLQKWLQPPAHPPRSPRIYPVLGGLTLCFLAALTWRQVGFWHDSGTLWNHTLEVTGPNSVAYNNLGTFLQGQGDLTGARRNYELALGQDPNFPDALSNLGQALVEMGNPRQGIHYLARAVQLSPTLVAARVNLGEAKVEAGDVGGGIALFKQVLAQQPSTAEAHRDYGMALAAQGNFAEAITELRTALSLSPEDPAAHADLGTVYAATNRWSEALAENRRAAALQPGEEAGHYNLGGALEHFGQWDEAAKEFRLAAGIAPNDADAHAQLGFALMKLGHRAEAAGELHRALGLNPALGVVRGWLRQLSEGEEK